MVPRASMPRPAHRPSVHVGDVARAVRYYREVLGFRILDDGSQGGSATVALDGAALELLPGKPPTPGHASSTVLYVRRPTQLLTRLDAHAALVVSCSGHDHADAARYSVRDGAGNLVCIAASPAPLARAMRALSPSVPPSWRDVLRRRREDSEARHDREALRTFHTAAVGDRPVWYMFFTSGLLHWVLRALDFVGDRATVVLIGSALPQEELRWIRENLDRPMHHLVDRVDDRVVWDMLLEISTADFGWIDIDCFVLNPDLLDELADLPPDAYANSVWSFEDTAGEPLGATFLLYLGIDAVRAVRSADPWARAVLYSSRGFDRRVPGRSLYCRVLSRRQRRRLLEVVPRLAPEDEHGRPVIPGALYYLDTLIVYQLLARRLGYRLGRVRTLRVRDADVGVQEQSDETVHVGGVSYAGALSRFSEDVHEPETRLRYLVADEIVLSRAVGQLPAAYQERADRIRGLLADLGVAPDETTGVARVYLVSGMGLSEDAANEVISGPVRPARRRVPPSTSGPGG